MKNNNKKTKTNKAEKEANIKIDTFRTKHRT